MRANEAALGLIRECEGLRLKAYADSGGRLTIGWGHAGKDVRPNSVITEETAEVLLAQDVAAAERAVRRLVWADLNENQFGAVVSWVFNLGEGKVRGSKTLSLLNQRRYLEFADALLQWDKITLADGTKKSLPGLTRRRQKERALFLTPALVKS